MTVLVDTSVWVDHLRRGNRELAGMLDQAAVVVHPFVVGELACGHLRQRTEILELLQQLPAAPLAAHAEVLHLVENCRLYGRDLGWIDAHLLAAARLMAVPLWTFDRALAAAAADLGLAP